MTDHDDKPSGSIAGRAARGAMWLMSGVYYGRLVNLLMTIILARMLLPKDFGLVALSTTLLTMLMAVTDLSLANALIHHKDPKAEDFDTAFTLGIVRGVLLAGLMVAGGFAMAAIYADQRLIAISAGLATRPLLSGLSSPYYVTFAKNLNFRVVVRTEAVNYTAQLVVSVAVALLTHSYWAIVAGVVAASIANVISAHWVAPYRPRFTLASWRKLMAFSVWMTLAQPIVIIGGRFENFLAGGMLGVASFGAYNVGSNVSAMATQSATVPLERVLFPSFAKITSDPERLRAAFQKAQSSLFAIGLPLGVGLALVAQPFVHLVLGPKWAITTSVIEFLAPVFGIQMAFGPTYALTFALGATRTLFIRSVMLMIFRVPIVLVGLYFYGLTGLLVARVVSGLLESLVNIYIVRSLIGVSAWEQVRVTWRSAVSGLVMVAAVLTVRTLLPPVDSITTAILALLILVPVGAVTYVGAHILVWVAAGRPGGGIEVEIHKVFEKYGGRLRRRPRQAAQ